jgi:hypothetical protein
MHGRPTPAMIGEVTSHYLWGDQDTDSKREQTPPAKTQGATGPNDAVEHVGGKGGHELTSSNNTHCHELKVNVPNGTSANTCNIRSS